MRAWLEGDRLKYGYADDGSGTSYAAVHLAGAAALWVAFHGASLELYPQPWQIVEAFRLLARQTARRPADWDDQLFGAGILDIEALLSASLPEAGRLAKRPRARDEII